MEVLKTTSPVAWVPFPSPSYPKERPSKVVPSFRIKIAFIFMNLPLPFARGGLGWGRGPEIFPYATFYLPLIPSLQRRGKSRPYDRKRLFHLRSCKAPFHGASRDERANFGSSRRCDSHHIYRRHRD